MPRHVITLSEEEVFDVSLATFYVFDKEEAGTHAPGIQLAAPRTRRLRRPVGVVADTAALEGAAAADTAAEAAEAALGVRRLRRLRLRLRPGGCCIWIGPVQIC